MKQAAVFLGGLVFLVGCGSGSPPNLAPDSPELGAVSEVSAGDREGQHLETIEEMLRSRVPGLQVVTLPNGDLSLRIRGGDRMGSEPAEPLVVIDGLAVQEGNVSRALRLLNPGDIDRIQVLRDVSSTSVYGIRGANGVILITTKRR